MSFLFIITFLISFIYSKLSFPLINENQSRNYENYYFYKDSSFLEYNLIKTLNSNYNDFSPNLIINLLNYGLNFWNETKFLPIEYLYNKNFTKCLLSFHLENLFNNTLFRIYFEGSGKHVNDLGNEQYCIMANEKSNGIDNLTYFLVLAYLEHPENLTNNEDKNFTYFLNQNYFYIGFCLPNDCKNIFQELISDKYFLDFLYHTFAISNFTLTEYKDYSKSYEDKYKNSDVLKGFILFIFLFKFIIG